MKRFIFTPAFIILFVLTNYAQTPSPTPKPVEDGDEVVKISTTLIQVDVTVTDNNGKIVRDLKTEDFEIYENGKKQEITNFSFVATAPATAPTIEKSEKSGENVVVPPPPSVSLKPEQVRRTIALVVDDLGLSFESVYQVRRALRKFVDEQMQLEDLVAIIRTGGGMGAQQQFTSDKRQLYAAIENIKWNSLGRGGLTAFAPLEATPLEQAKVAGAEVTAEQLEEEQKQLRDFSDFREDVFSVGTLGAINFIVKGMNELPGRKSIMLFSDGFAVCSANNQDRCSRLVDSVRQLTDLSNRAAVSIYTFDARGLQVTGITAQDNTNSVAAERIQSTSSDRSAELFDKQEGLAYLARETGGRSFFNNNDINKGLEKALEDQKGYYLLGYQPDSETFDAKTRRFNKLQIKVIRKGTNVRYRSGFFGVTDDQIKKPVNQNSAQQLQTALTSPFAVNEIALRLNTLFGNDKQQGTFVRSLLHVNAKDLKFTDEADGSKKAVFEVLAVSFGENGTVIDQIAKSYTINAKNEAYQKLISDGFVYYFVFPVKKPGAYQYRVAIRDGASQKIGSANQFIEVPNLKKAGLKISGLILENQTVEQWQKFAQSSTGQIAALDNSAPDATDPLNDTALRKFKRGTILRYGFEVYNAKLDAAQKSNLNTQIRMFRDGKLIFEGKKQPFDVLEQTDAQIIKSSGAMSLGTEMQMGDYVLQLVITDNLAKEKRRLATQFVEFEVQ